MMGLSRLGLGVTGQSRWPGTVTGTQAQAARLHRAGLPSGPASDSELGWPRRLTVAPPGRDWQVRLHWQAGPRAQAQPGLRQAAVPGPACQAQDTGGPGPMMVTMTRTVHGHGHGPTAGWHAPAAAHVSM